MSTGRRHTRLLNDVDATHVLGRAEYAPIALSIKKFENVKISLITDNYTKYLYKSTKISPNTNLIFCYSKVKNITALYIKIEKSQNIIFQQHNNFLTMRQIYILTVKKLIMRGQEIDFKVKRILLPWKKKKKISTPLTKRGLIFFFQKSTNIILPNLKIYFTTVKHFCHFLGSNNTHTCCWWSYWHGWSCFCYTSRSYRDSFWVILYLNSVLSEIFLLLLFWE